MNWQHCANVAFVGLSQSWEQYFQAIRRCWRFGQERPVTVHTIIAEQDDPIRRNLDRKESDAQRMADEMGARMSETMKCAMQQKSFY